MKTFLNQNGNAAILFDQSLRQYFSGFASSFGIVVLINNQTYLICDNRYFEAAQKKARAKVLPYTKSALDNLLKNCGIKKVGVVLSATNAKDYLSLKAQGLDVVDISPMVFNVTKVKDKSAINSIKKACKITQNALKNNIDNLKIGISEKEFANLLEFDMKNSGADGVSFDIIVAFGKHSSVPHHKTSNTRLIANQPVLIDFGCKVNGWCADMTRTIFYGNADNFFKKAYQAVLKAHLTSASFIKIGQPAYLAHETCQSVLKEFGMDKFFTHSLGHGLGLDIHEEPYLKENSQTLLEENTPFTIEPGVYFTNKFGIRIEDTYILTPSGAKSLINFKKELIQIKI